MNKTKHFKRLWGLMLLLVAMLVPQGAWAIDFISEIKYAVHETEATAFGYLSGYTIIRKELNNNPNKSGERWVYIGYKTDTDPSKAITDIMVVSGSSYLSGHLESDNSGNNYVTFTGDSRKWYRCPSQGESADINKGNGGDDLCIYYTRDGNTTDGKSAITSLDVAYGTGLSGWTYAKLFKNSSITANGNTNEGTNGTPTYITYTTHTHAYTAAFSWATNGKTCTATVSCSCGDTHSNLACTVTDAPKSGAAATCTVMGWTTYTAKVTSNGKDFSATKDVQDIAALGHDYSSETTTDTYLKSAVTCTADAVYYHKCSRCDSKGSTTWTKTGTALGHTYGAGSWSWADDGHSATCTRTCGRTGCTTNTTGHTSSKSVTLGNGITSAQQVAPKCTEMGTTRYTATATVEGTQYTSTKDVVDIAVAGHNIDLQTGYCQNTDCGADLRVTTSYRVPTYKTPGVASSGIASWQTVSDVKAIPLPSSTTPQTWYSQYYVVQSGQTVSLSKGAICAGNVHLIVEDGATLNINANAQNNAGIAVSGGSTSLTIYGQTENTGKLTSISGKYGACIGGNKGSAGANITINGADVKARSEETYTTGLGGGYNNEGYNIIINGGNVTAAGYRTAGIGGGAYGDGHDIIINGGNVKAADDGAGYYGAGIGGGTEKNGYNITINDGHITAIGSGGGAGIGGGYQHSGYNITIAGGTIDARGGGGYADGIGNGRNPSGYYDNKNGYIKFGLKVGIMSGSTVIDNTYGDMFDVVHKKQYITTHIHDLVYNGNATCTTAGTMSAQCDLCNKTFEFEDPDHPSLSHNFTNHTLTASPVEEGLYAYACDNGCGEHNDAHIIKDFNGAGNHLELTKDSEGNYSTSEDITLADANGFVSPVDFTAASVTYNRNIVMDDGMYSFIVPFDIPADQAAELGKFYQYSKHEEGEVYFDDIEKIGEGEVEANTAYFFKPAKNITSITVDDAEIKATTSMPNAENPSEPGLYGTYSQIEIPVGAYGYGNMGFFIKAGTDNLLRPFRAYLWLGNGASMAKALAFFGDYDDITGINNIETDTDLDMSKPIYTLSGQRIMTPKKGEIYIQNGKKVIIK